MCVCPPALAGGSHDRCCGPEDRVIATGLATRSRTVPIRNHTSTTESAPVVYGKLDRGVSILLVQLRSGDSVSFDDIVADGKSIQGLNEFLGDYLLGLLVSANFIASASLGDRLRALLGIEKHIRYLASFTLSVYLFHMPLTVLVWNGLGVRSVAGFALLLVAGIFVLGSLTERRNRFYRARLEKMLDFGHTTPYIDSPEPPPNLDNRPKVH
jgi:hypothetical protein